MIRNFEEYTHELNPWESKIVLPFITRNLLLAIGKDKAITSFVLMDTWYSEGNTKKLSGARVRKVINVIRRYNLITCLMATAKGYYISDNREEIETYLESLNDRIRAILATRRAVKNQLKDFGGSNEGIQTQLNW